MYITIYLEYTKCSMHYEEIVIDQESCHSRKCRHSVLLSVGLNMGHQLMNNSESLLGLYLFPCVGP